MKIPHDFSYPDIERDLKLLEEKRKAKTKARAKMRAGVKKWPLLILCTWAWWFAVAFLFISPPGSVISILDGFCVVAPGFFVLSWWWFGAMNMDAW